MATAMSPARAVLDRTETLPNVFPLGNAGTIPSSGSVAKAYYSISDLVEFYPFVTNRRAQPPKATGFTGSILASGSERLPEDTTRNVTTPIAWKGFRRSPYAGSADIFAAIQSLYLSDRSRDRQIADRITILNRDAVAEDQNILASSLDQFTKFFLSHANLGLPKITLTPDGTIRTRWIHGKGNFVAIEFTGMPNVKLVAEIPRAAGLTATHFDSEPLESVVAIAQGMGASFV